MAAALRAAITGSILAGLALPAVLIASWGAPHNSIEFPGAVLVFWVFAVICTIVETLFAVLGAVVGTSIGGPNYLYASLVAGGLPIVVYSVPVMARWIAGGMRIPIAMLLSSEYVPVLAHSAVAAAIGAIAGVFVMRRH